MKRKKGKYRIGPQRDWDDWTSKTLGVDGTPPWWAVPCDVVDANVPCLTASALSFRKLGIIYDELNKDCDERGANE